MRVRKSHVPEVFIKIGQNQQNMSEKDKNLLSNQKFARDLGHRVTLFYAGMHCQKTPCILFLRAQMP